MTSAIKSQAQRYFIQSLRPAKEAGDTLEREGNLEEAGHYALLTTEAADGVNSQRSTQVGTELRATLSGRHEITAVKEFLDRSDPATKK